jgi:phosphate acetyltransferase
LQKKYFKGHFFNEILAMSETIERTIAFSDGDDIRLVKALDFFRNINKSRFILIGDENGIYKKIKEAGITRLDNFTVADPKKSEKNEEYREIIKKSYEKRNRDLTEEQILSLSYDTSFYTSLLLKTDEADCAVGGSISSTEALMRAVIFVLGLTKGKKYLCGSAFVDIPDCVFGMDGTFCLSDPAIIPKPDEEQLIDVVLSSYDMAKSVFKVEPVIAMLSYSTKGSARGEEIDKLTNVVEKVKKLRPEIKIDGELQFDAAIVPEVAKIKLSYSEAAGKANVLIFPELNSANIGYKIMQRIGKAEVCGTVIQGAAKPFNDLSRGCFVADIVSLISMTLLQRKGMEDNSLL